MVPRIEPAVFLSAPDLGSHLDDVQRIRVYGRDDGASGLNRIWQDFLGLPPERPERRVTEEFSWHRLPQLLKGHRRVLPRRECADMAEPPVGARAPSAGRWDPALAVALAECGVRVEEETVLEDLLTDLGRRRSAC